MRAKPIALILCVVAANGKRSKRSELIPLNGVKKDHVSCDFEHGFGPYSFMPGLNGTAEFSVEFEESGNKYLRWNARKLGWTFADWEEKFWDEEEEQFVPGLSVDYSELYSHQALVQSDWWKRYCISLDVKSFYPDSQMNITTYWVKQNGDESVRDEMQIYTKGDTCTDTIQGKITNHCIEERRWTTLQTTIFKPPAAKFSLEFQVYKRSLFGLDNIKLSDCSTMHRKPTTTTNLNAFTMPTLKPTMSILKSFTLPTLKPSTKPATSTTISTRRTTNTPRAFISMEPTTTTTLDDSALVDDNVEVPVFLKSRAKSYVKKLKELFATEEPLVVPTTSAFEVPPTLRIDLPESTTTDVTVTAEEEEQALSSTWEPSTRQETTFNLVDDRTFPKRNVIPHTPRDDRSSALARKAQCISFIIPFLLFVIQFACRY